MISLIRTLHGRWATVLALLTAMACTGAQPLPQDPVWVCPAHEADTRPPLPTASGCTQQSLWTADPQGRHVWVLRELDLTPAHASAAWGVQISAKAASRLYLNGIWLGDNGVPADTAQAERPGLMDTVMRIPTGALRSGVNQLAVRMSAHHGSLRLRMPIHFLAPVPYSHVQDRLLRHYLPILVSLGAFGLACCYFLSLTLRGERPADTALLAVLALLAALQLLLEISRGLWAYAYPYHDLRLIGILLCAVGFGLGLVALSVRQFVPPLRRWRLWTLAALTLVVSAGMVNGMDSKASVVLFLASAWSGGIATYAGRKTTPHAGAHAWAFAGFGVANLLTPELFLDRYFFLLLAGLLIFLMVQQALAHGRVLALQREQRVRADRLQTALEERAQAQQEVVLSIPGIGQLRRVPANRIAHVQGAGDYSELHLITGETVLHTAGLNALETELPSYFLRVHRSHLVNTKLIERLQQGEGGTGILHLQHGRTVPVSRRIMPGVRKALR